MLKKQLQSVLSFPELFLMEYVKLVLDIDSSNTILSPVCWQVEVNIGFSLKPRLV